MSSATSSSSVAGQRSRAGELEAWGRAAGGAEWEERERTGEKRGERERREERGGPTGGLHRHVMSAKLLLRGIQVTQ